jgi:hypothetical protein
MKTIFASKTFWLAVIQAIVGVWALVAADPAYDAVAWVAIVKSVLDVGLRFATSKPVSIGGQ